MSDFSGNYVDGVTATRRSVRVTLAESGILVTGIDGAPVASWGYDEVTVVPDERERGPLRLAHGRARLAVEDAGFAEAFYARAPAHRPAAISRRLVKAGLAIAASVGVVAAIWWGLPYATQWAVGWIPTSLEERIGDRELDAFGLTECRNPAGQAALASLVHRLTAKADLRFHARVIVADWGMVNAFALPGGRIVVLAGLLKQAKSADEVAGVLAHELTHTLKRHPLRHLMAQASIGVLGEAMLGYGASGGDIGALMASFTYSRAEEAEADAGGIELLRKANVSAAGFADFFERLAHGPESAIPAYLSNHPTPETRLAMVRSAGSTGTTPALTPAQWSALQHICDDGTHAKLPEK